MKLNILALSVFSLLSLVAVSPNISNAADETPFGTSRSEDASLILMGPVEVHPFVSLQEAYSDNIFLDSDKKHDFITTLVPGVQLKMPISRHALFLTGIVTVNRYLDHSSESKTDWNLSGAGDFNFGSKINLKLSDNYRAGHEPRSQSAVANSISLEKFKNNGASGSFTYILADISKLQIDYSNDYWSFTNSPFRSRDENMVSAYAYYRVMPKTSVFTEYEFKNIYFTEKNVADGDLDNKVHSALLGVTWELSAQSKGTVKGGFLYKVFDDPSRKNFSTITASVDVSHNFSDSNSAKLVGARTVFESSLSGTSYSVSTGLTGEFTHKFNDRISTGLKASLSSEGFSDNVDDGTGSGTLVKRSDTVVQAGAKAMYSFRRWLDSTLEYYWRQKNSNINTNDSTENNVALTLRASF
jgi:hypothetical protein